MELFVREGDPTPTFMIRIAAPKKYKLQHRLLDSNHNPVVRNCYSSTFNKVRGAPTIVVALPCTRRDCSPKSFFVAHKHGHSINMECYHPHPPLCNVQVLGKGNNKEHELWTAFPTHGEFYVVVDVLEDLSADFVIKPSEDSKAIQLNIYDAYEGFRCDTQARPTLKKHKELFS